MVPFSFEVRVREESEDVHRLALHRSQLKACRADAYPQLLHTALPESEDSTGFVPLSCATVSATAVIFLDDVSECGGVLVNAGLAQPLELPS